MSKSAFTLLFLPLLAVSGCCPPASELTLADYSTGSLHIIEAPALGPWLQLQAPASSCTRVTGTSMRASANGEPAGLTMAGGGGDEFQGKAGCSTCTAPGAQWNSWPVDADATFVLEQGDTRMSVVVAGLGAARLVSFPAGVAAEGHAHDSVRLTWSMTTDTLSNATVSFLPAAGGATEVPFDAVVAGRELATTIAPGTPVGSGNLVVRATATVPARCEGVSNCTVSRRYEASIPFTVK